MHTPVSLAHILLVRNISNEKDQKNNLNQSVDEDLVLMLALHSLRDLWRNALHPGYHAGQHKQMQCPVSHNTEIAKGVRCLGPELSVWPLFCGTSVKSL